MASASPFWIVVRRKNLRQLILSGTLVTAKGIEEFKKSLTLCAIDWDEPKKEVIAAAGSRIH